ncbi:hypothetical protein RFI_17527 [Reticulomyxa filosa]|uniref:Uncharacterized protein n=1 Tax=Reticulomyxa filosa TaxID=46433 RepID=X6N1T7_RETFI|nr:hypothetical protein RFI_17527 [Reticulomyxa filosa]|eukprot:ETO19704.1 hypothetical protein RFI_17527 [Reticulomyxa filosa]
MDHSSIEYVYYRYLLNKLAKMKLSQQEVSKLETQTTIPTVSSPNITPVLAPVSSHSPNKSSIPALSHAMSVDPPSDDNNNNKSKIPRRSRFRSRQPNEMASSSSNTESESEHDKHRPRFREENAEEQEGNEDQILEGVLAGRPNNNSQRDDLAKIDAYVNSSHQKDQEKLRSIDRRKTNVNHPGHHIGDFLPSSALVEFRARADNQRSTQHRADANKPWDPSPEDDEYTLYKKRMMLAYRHRPNPLVNFTKK